MRAAAGVLVGVGVAFVLLGGIGLLRLPDVYARMHAATKAPSLGVACILAGTAALLSSPVGVAKLLVAILFLFATAPVAAHAIGRAAYRAGVPLWEGTLYDELGGRVDRPPS